MYFCQYGVLRKGGTSAMLAIELAPVVLVVEASSPGCAAGSQKCTETEKAAQRHCPADTVVWVNTSIANYHFKDDPWYGRTQRGIYACKVEADKDGLHAWTNPR